MRVPHHIKDAARRRALESKEARVQALQLLRLGRPLEIEPEDRKIQRIARRVGIDRETAAAIAGGRDPAELGLDSERLRLATAVIGGNDITSIAFLERARHAANAVGHLIFFDGDSVGTCFMISPKLLITNHHVLKDETVAKSRRVQFNYENDAKENPLPIATFALDPDTFFLSNNSTKLDFAVVALGEPVGIPPPFERSFCPLTGLNDEFGFLGDFVNLIGHPGGGAKSIVLRENRLIHRFEPGSVNEAVLQYTADTEDSSSGLPVFNDDWHVVALHHGSVDAGDITICGENKLDVVNEGARASFIVKALKARRNDGSLNDDQKKLLDEALAEP